MQRLYSRFPGGWPGSVLLLLRGAGGVTLIVQAAAYLPEVQNPGTTFFAAGLLALSGLAMIVGLFARAFGAVAVLGYIALTCMWLPAPSHNFFSGNPLSIDVIILAVACTMFGPGAFSLDAHLFGRRKIIIPQASHAANS